ncbi:hypothetical protein PIB30_030331 [Stylosanthes scabra]|uniref:Uncharacterized protein n=1 Tax=Stylosanthes scabra TaxID=79078 RepID=A0ABU6TDD9_9FABA|nr:hypothetical protein [Stylosanthes scabra]
MGHDDRIEFFFWGMVHGSESVNPLRRIGEANNQASVLSGLGHCQTANERLRVKAKKSRVQGLGVIPLSFAGDGILTMIIESSKALVIPQAGNLRFSPPSSYTTQNLFFPLFLHDETNCTLLSTTGCIPSSSTSSGSVGSVHRERPCSPRTPLPPMAPAPVPGPVYSVPHTPMCDARRFRSLFPRRRVAPPTPHPPSPPSSDEEPSAETYDPVAELVGDPDEPYIAERVLYRAPEASHSDASYGSERESASTDSAPSSHHPSGNSSGSVSLGYGSASSGSASNGASDDDLVNRYFAGTFPSP